MSEQREVLSYPSFGVRRAAAARRRFAIAFSVGVVLAGVLGSIAIGRLTFAWQVRWKPPPVLAHGVYYMAIGVWWFAVLAVARRVDRFRASVAST